MDNALAGTLQMFQSRAVPWGGINRGPKGNNSKHLSYLPFRKQTVAGTDRICTIFQGIPLARTRSWSPRIRNTLILGLGLRDGPKPALRLP
jgi:hypothetical protein